MKSEEEIEEEQIKIMELMCLSGNWGISIPNVCAPFLTLSITLLGALLAPALLSPHIRLFLP